MGRKGLSYDDKNVKDTLYRLDQENELTMNKIVEIFSCSKSTAQTVYNRYKKDNAREIAEKIKQVDLGDAINRAIAEQADKLSQHWKKEFDDLSKRNDEILADTRKVVDELAETKVNLDDAKFEIKRLEVELKSTTAHWKDRYKELSDREENVKAILAEANNKFVEADKLRAVAEKERDMLRTQVEQKKKR